MNTLSLFLVAITELAVQYGAYLKSKRENEIDKIEDEIDENQIDDTSTKNDENSSENKNSEEVKEKVLEPKIEDNQPTGIY